MNLTNETGIEQELPMFLTVKDLQRILRISQSVAYRLVNTGQIQAKTVGRQLRISRDEFLKFVNAN